MSTRRCALRGPLLIMFVPQALMVVLTGMAGIIHQAWLSSGHVLLLLVQHDRRSDPGRDQVGKRGSIAAGGTWWGWPGTAERGFLVLLREPGRRTISISGRKSNDTKSQFGFVWRPFPNGGTNCFDERGKEGDCSEVGGGDGRCADDVGPCPVRELTYIVGDPAGM